MSLWKLYSDGGCKPNPGKGAYCAALYKDDNLVESVGGYIGESTNNQSEYKAFYSGIQLMNDHCNGNSKIDVYLDSQLVLKQVTGEWAVKEESLKKISLKCKDGLSGFLNVNFNWVKGHSGDSGNNYVDSICTHLINTAKGIETKHEDNTPSRIYINCPFSDKDEAKSLGAKWDVKEKRWWIPHELQNQFEKWL